MRFLFICGVGTVGSSLIEQIRSQRERLMHERGLKLNVVGIASGHYAVFDRDGIDLTNYRDTLKAGGESNMQRLKSEVIGMNIFNSVFVDCTASDEVAALYKDFLNHNISVVAANKVAASSQYENYSELKQTARRRGVKFLFATPKVVIMNREIPLSVLIGALIFTVLIVLGCVYWQKKNKI